MPVSSHVTRFAVTRFAVTRFAVTRFAVTRLALTRFGGLVLVLCGSTLGFSDDSDEGAPTETRQLPSDFEPICSGGQTPCNTARTPPNLVGNYVGEAKTVLTTNELWS